MGAQFISLLTILIAVGSVMFLAYIMTKFVGKKSSGMMKSKYMKIIDTLSFGFDKTIYLVQVGEQFVLMHISVKGMEFICNIDAELIKPTIANTPVEGDKSFGKYFDFFRTDNKIEHKIGNEVNENINKLRDLFNNKNSTKR